MPRQPQRYCARRQKYIIMFYIIQSFLHMRRGDPRRGHRWRAGGLRAPQPLPRPRGGGRGGRRAPY